MTSQRSLIEYLVLLLSLFGVIFAQEEIPKPKFPDVFQVEVQGIFQDEKVEVDGSLYYDKVNNRAVLSYTYQNESTTSIFNFNDNQLIYISGVECSVTEIGDESFFQYHTDEKTKKKTISSPEEIFFFTKSVLDRQEMSIFPSYIYTTTIDIPHYGVKNCEVNHIFSKPELEMPDCEGHSCRPTLVSISVKCPPPEDDKDATEIFHIYNFFRFRSAIKDNSVFQPPVGVHCDVPNQKPYPEFPAYYSFSYDLIEEQQDTDVISPGVFTVHKRVWYDTKLRLIRMDEFDRNGLIVSSRIFDFYGQIAYTIVASVPVCEPGDLEQNIALDVMTRLPKIFFAKKAEDRKNAVYIGKRNVHGLDFDVWTQSVINDETEAKNVLEFYFTNNIQKTLNDSQGNYLQISHADIYTYQRDDNSGLYDLSLLTYLSISNFRSKPKEWEAFDISSCFKADQKKSFRLKVDGPAVVKNSLMYEEILEKLYMKLIILTRVSVIRISQLKGRFDGIYMSEFTGWILHKIEREGIENKEPGMDEAYNIIENAAADGNLTITVKKDDKDQIYKVTVLSPTAPSPDRCISGSTLAAVSLVLLFMGITFGLVGYYVFLKKRTSSNNDKVQLHTL